MEYFGPKTVIRSSLRQVPAPEHASAARRRAGNWLFVCARILVAAILVTMGFAGTSVAQKKTPPPAPVDLNVANAKELEQIPGIGPVTAKAIVDFRQKSGSFKRVEDLLVIRGISERKLKLIRPYVTVVPPAKAPAKSLPPAKAGQPAKPLPPKPPSTAQ
jgi:competence protein ComEA